jgi:xylulokinase
VQPPSTTDPVLLGLDLGTSTVKAALFTPHGDLLGLEREEYLLTPDSERVEADPEVYWEPVAFAVRRLLDAFDGRAEQIVAVSTSTFGESVFPMAADGSPSRRSISWMDTRSSHEAQTLIERAGARTLLEVSGQPDINAIWPATKLMWLAKHEPEVFRLTARFLLPDDYLLYRLSGEIVGEHTMWGSSLIMDIRRKTWADPIVDLVGVRRDQLPPLTATGTVIGRISPACAEATGLSTQTQVVAGAMDQMCAAVGAGNITPGILTESTGTVVALLATIPEPILDPVTKVPCHIHALPQTYCLLPWSPTGGLVLKWFKDRFGEAEIARASASGADPYDLLCGLAEQVPPGSDGLLMLPFLEGAGFPQFDPSALGVFFGITLHHGKGHFTRAILESVAFMIRSDVEALERLGCGASEVRVLGGGAKSRLWSQIKADVLGLPMIVPANREAAVLGAAIIAAVGVGLHADYPTAVGAMTRLGARLEPDDEVHTLYNERYRLYRSLFESVRHLF